MDDDRAVSRARARARATDERGIVSTGAAPAALGPYSQAVRAGSLVFTSMQIGLDPASGRLVEGGIEAETARALDNLAAILAAAGTGLASVVKATVFLADLADFAAMNAVYGDRFAVAPPARAAVEVAALPRGARVGIELVAALEG